MALIPNNRTSKPWLLRIKKKKTKIVKLYKK